MTPATSNAAVYAATNTPPKTDHSPSRDRSSSPGRYKNVRKTQFQARNSRLDVQTIFGEQSEFRGFFVLFWVCAVLYLLSAFLFNWRRDGQPLRLRLMDTFSKDLLMFFISDLVMVSFTLVCLPLQWLISGCQWMPISVGIVLKHVLQAILLLGTVAWTMYRDWPWPQTATLCLHAVAMYMKMHSYLSCNTELETHRRRVGAIKMLLAMQSKLQPRAEPTPFSRRFSAVRRRRSSSQGKDEKPAEEPERVSDQLSEDVDKVWNEMETRLLEEVKELEDILIKGQTTYPANQTVRNFFDFLLVPTFVYELEYPRTSKIRLPYLAEKTAATIGIFTMLYYLVEHFISPTIESMGTMSVAEAILLLLLPFMFCWLMIFFIMFECVANFAAELTCFADRHFYDDWWNSLSFDEFARKWNKPVHEFLLRHIYLEAIDTYKLSKTNATFVTFFFSALLHELVVAAVTRKIKFFFFFLQMSQIPLIYIARVTQLKKQPLLANTFFWLSMMAGIPLLTIIYTYDHVVGTLRLF